MKLIEFKKYLEQFSNEAKVFVKFENDVKNKMCYKILPKCYVGENSKHKVILYMTDNPYYTTEDETNRI